MYKTIIREKNVSNPVKVFADIVEDSAMEQIIKIANYDPYIDSTIRIMPDVHSGKGCVIGTTMTLKDKVTPNLVGVDIGCGMMCVKLKDKDCEEQLDKLDKVIHKYVPAGMYVHDSKSNCDCYKDYVETLYAFEHIGDNGKHRIKRSIGTLGGGNHFIELDKDGEGNYYLVIHTGSRHLGVQVCNYYQQLAVDNMKRKVYDFDQLKNNVINTLKKEGRQREINDKLKELSMNRKSVVIDEDLAYLEGEDFKHYLHDMELVQTWASANRKAIADRIISRMKWTVDEEFTTIHNYIDVDNMILRKGSVSAQKGEKLIIPINMRDGSLICVGKGNPDWNYSAPHGAGRIMSRTEARNNINIDDFKESMKDIYTTTVDMSTIDEAPMAYKPIDDIIKCIQPEVDICTIIKPVYNFKAAE